MKSWIVRLLFAAAVWFVGLALVPGCAALQRAAEDVGAKGVAAGSATVLGSLLYFVSPAGWLGGLLAAGGGAVLALLFGGGDTTVHEAPASPWSGPLTVGALVLAVLLLRAWGHWAPPLLEVLKRAAKGTPRALLGGPPKKPDAPRFRRRAD